MNKNEIKYYKVVCKCGHVGIRGYIPVQFAIKATSKKEAAAIGRELPRVKHQHKDAILNVYEITYEEYLEIKNENENDPYLHCKSKQEQKLKCDLSNRIEIDYHNIKAEHDKAKRRERIQFKMKKYKQLGLSV